MEPGTHKPVLLKEVIEYLNPKPGEFIVDGTLDGGGHAAEIMKLIKPSGRFMGMDWDPSMIDKSKEKWADEKDLMLVNSNYADLADILASNNLGKIDGLLLDLGFSSEQLEGSGKGFSFKADEPLIMTYDADRAPAKEVIRRLSQEELANVIYEFGEERLSRQIAKAIKDRLRKGSIETTGQLADVIAKALPAGYEHGRIHPATRTFQALRIYVNDELGNIKKILSDLPKILNTGGRAVIITFHSLEDRIIKQHFKHLEKEGFLQTLTKKPIFTSREEVMSNPRSRSAKLRAAFRK